MRLLLGLLVISVLLIVLLLVRVGGTDIVALVKPTPYIAPTSSYEPDDENDLFEAVNNWRISQNLPPYKKSAVACDIATKRLPQAKANWDAGHTGFYEMIQKKPVGQTFSENLAKGFIFSDRTLNGWLNSPLHRENLDKQYTHSCIKCDSGYCVHIFSYF